MANWFNKLQDQEERSGRADVVRYRATVPVDIWIRTTGDNISDQENVYNMLKDILRKGSLSVEHRGFNDLLELNDIQKYAN